MRVSLKVSAILAASGALLATAAMAQPGQAPSGVTVAKCTDLKNVLVVNSTDPESTSSSVYVDFPGTLVHFTTTKPGCVIGTFSSPANPLNDTIFVQMELDSPASCLPNGDDFPNRFATGQAQLTANSMTYLCPDVQPGKHVIRVQWKSDFGTLVILDGFTMTVAHH